VNIIQRRKQVWAFDLGFGFAGRETYIKMAREVPFEARQGLDLLKLRPLDKTVRLGEDCGWDTTTDQVGDQDEDQVRDQDTGS
jgi:hypothetical protein